MTQALNLALLGNNVDSNGQLSVTTGVVGTLPVANGGTGKAALTTNNVLLGNGTSAVQEVAPGASGNVLQSDGTTWASVAAGGYIGNQAEIFTSTGVFTVPPGITAVKVTVVGGGGGGGNATASANPAVGAGGGGGGVAVEYITGLLPSSTVTVTVGTGGAAITAGGTSSFGAFCSATGGAAGASTGTTATSAAGGNGGVGSGGSYNLAGGVGGNGIAGNLGSCFGDSAKASGPGGGAGDRLSLKTDIVLRFDGTGLNRIYGSNGYINGKGGDSITASVNSVGNPGTGFGNGGSGGKRFTGTSLASGGAGSAGVVIVEY